MAWEVEYTDEWGEWFHSLTEKAQEEVAAVIGLLETLGPQLPFPYSSGIATSRNGHMRELRIQFKTRPLRTLYAFDPRRMAILLLGGDKGGDDRWYETWVPVGPAVRRALGVFGGRGADLMAQKFRKLMNEMSTERQARVRRRTEELLGTVALNGLRKARSLSQEELAEILDVNQATVSKLERRADMYISTMRRFVRAMGGELEIRARFPEGVVEIDQFGALVGEPENAPASRSDTPAATKKRTSRTKTQKRKRQVSEAS